MDAVVSAEDRSVTFVVVAPPDSTEIDVDELAAKVVAGALVVDVREPDEYARGHVPGAVSVPLAGLADRLAAFSSGGDGPAYVICQVGERSRWACEVVGAHGIDAVNVAGGTGAWVASGRDIVTGDRPS